MPTSQRVAGTREELLENYQRKQAVDF